MSEEKKTWKFVSLKNIMVLLLLTVAIWLLTTLPKIPEFTSKDSNPSWSEYDRVISGFDNEDRKLVEKSVDDLDMYFDEMEKNIDPFLDDLYSYKSKGQMLWYLCKDIRLKEVEGLNPYLMMLPLYKPVREGESLNVFLENKFNNYFGDSDAVNKQLHQIVANVSLELERNNERLAVELGEVTASSHDDAGENVDTAGADSTFKDQAKKLSMAIVARTSGLQAGVELSTLTVVESYMVQPIAALLVEIMVEQGIIAAEGLAGSFTTFGIGLAIAISVDVVANKISRSSLEPQIRNALRIRRQEIMTSFKRLMLAKLRTFHGARRQAIRDTLIAAR